METPRRFLRTKYLEDLEKISTPFKMPPSPFMKNLGYGTGVHVFRLERSPRDGELRSPWAVKRTTKRVPQNEEEFNMRIQKEAEILRKLSHPNIVGFRGMTISKDGKFSLILECCKTCLGSMLENRYEDDLGPLPAANTIKMINDIAKGLDYLHTEANLLHGDLKSFNILVKGDFEICKLCDFGVSLPLDEDGLIDFNKNPKIRYVGTSLWTAPEIMDDSDTINCKADIFSFGLVIYETIALTPPHTTNIVDREETPNKTIDSSASETCDITQSSNDEESFLERLTSDMDGALGTRPPLPEAFELPEDYNCIMELFYCCTNELAEDRPMAKTIWQTVEKLMHEKNDKENINDVNCTVAET